MSIIPTIHVSDGRAVYLRHATHDDAASLEHLFYRLTPHSIAMWLGIGAPSTAHFAQMLAAYADVDGRRRLSLVAEAGPVVAVARYVSLAATPHAADIAVVVEDSWQGQHLGRILLQRLTHVARQHHIRMFTADCQGQNMRAVRLLAAVFPRRKAQFAQGMWHYEIPLLETPTTLT